MDRIVGSATVAIANLVAEQKRAGVDMVSFSVGEPDFPSPAHAIEAAKAALDAGQTKYTLGPGIPALREAVAKQAQDELRLPCEASNVLVTPTKQAVAMTFLALAGQGDEVLLPDPGWVSYAPITEWAHAKPVAVPLHAEDGFGMKADAVQERISSKTKMLLLNSPANPTGGINDPEEIKAMADLAVDHDFWIVSDEIYRKLIYEGQHLSPGSLDNLFERTITIDGMSKAYSMTGWRVGWAIAPEPAFKQINKLQSHSVTHCTSFAQHGAVAAIEGPQDGVEEMRKAFLERRDVMVSRLNAMAGVSCPTPQGAFYVFPKFDHLGGDDDALCKLLIEKAHVAGTPGSAFGDMGKGHLRFSYATSMDRIHEGLDRIERVLQSL